MTAAGNSAGTAEQPATSGADPAQAPAGTLPAKPPAERLLFLDAMRAFASTMIVWHHFALYPPFNEWAAPLIGGLIDWFAHYSRATQVFFVVGGYVMARSMSRRSWDIAAVGQFVVRRYCRLGLPYLAAIAVAIVACEFGRGWLPESVVGPPPSVPRLLAHAVFLQQILGYEQFSAGIWFVCINFQLGLIYVATLYLRDALTRLLRQPADCPWLDAPLIVGWALAAASLFYFNLDPAWDAWAVYFFPYFFMGIMVHRGQRSGLAQVLFWLYLLLIIGAMIYDWRWRLVSALVVGTLLFGAEKSGLSTRWPKSRLIAWLGRMSYSLFLIHFPVLVIVATLWVRMGWHSAPAAVWGLVVAYFASVGASAAFYRIVEIPAAKLSRQA